jgi:hypothetical protein
MIMNGTGYSPLPGSLSAELDKSFVEGVDWPIDRASLAALLDMGLNPAQIARYFSVTPDDVVRLLRAVGKNGKR